MDPFEKHYAALRRAVAGQMRRESVGHTLTPTALLHEVWMRLRKQTHLDWNNIADLLTAARVAAKRTLVDYSRNAEAKRRRQKTGLADHLLPVSREMNHVEIRTAMTRLADSHPDLHQLVVQHLVEGWTVEEIAAREGQSPSKTKRDLRAGIEILRSYTA